MQLGSIDVVEHVQEVNQGDPAIASAACAGPYRVEEFEENAQEGITEFNPDHIISIISFIGY